MLTKTIRMMKYLISFVLKLSLLGVLIFNSCSIQKSKKSTPNQEHEFFSFKCNYFEMNLPNNLDIQTIVNGGYSSPDILNCLGYSINEGNIKAKEILSNLIEELTKKEGLKGMEEYMVLSTLASDVLPHLKDQDLVLYYPEILEIDFENYYKSVSSLITPIASLIIEDIMNYKISDKKLINKLNFIRNNEGFESMKYQLIKDLKNGIIILELKSPPFNSPEDYFKK